jgi:hypothetical protein
MLGLTLIGVILMLWITGRCFTRPLGAAVQFFRSPKKYAPEVPIEKVSEVKLFWRTAAILNPPIDRDSWGDVGQFDRTVRAFKTGQVEIYPNGFGNSPSGNYRIVGNPIWRGIGNIWDIQRWRDRGGLKKLARFCCYFNYIGGAATGILKYATDKVVSGQNVSYFSNQYKGPVQMKSCGRYLSQLFGDANQLAIEPRHSESSERHNHGRGNHDATACVVGIILFLTGCVCELWGLRTIGEVNWRWLLLALILAQIEGFTLFYGVVPWAWNWAWLWAWTFCA